jgi:hypothetical protein
MVEIKKETSIRIIISIRVKKDEAVIILFFNVNNSSVSSHKAVIDDFTDNLNFGNVVLQFVNLIILCSQCICLEKNLPNPHTYKFPVPYAAIRPDSNQP